MGLSRQRWLFHASIRHQLIQLQFYEKLIPFTLGLPPAELSELITCQCCAIDIRGHGDTITKELELDIDTLATDVSDVIAAAFPDHPSTFLIGHSMGGAIAVHTGFKKLVDNLCGLVVIDLVEGTAIEALQSMQSFLRGRPQTFESLEKAIEWSVRSGHIRNIDSAKVSMVGQLKRIDDGRTATCELNDQNVTNSGEQHQPETFPSDTLESISEDATTVKKADDSHTTGKYTWRIDLAKTSNHWEGWFTGLSQKFLSISAPKLLLLAGVDRLDKDMTIGQMQGKFQLQGSGQSHLSNLIKIHILSFYLLLIGLSTTSQVLNKSGHAIHEDLPDKVAESLASFLVRFKFAEPKSSFSKPFPAC